MSRWRLLGSLVLMLSVSLAVLAADPAIPELFKRAKDEFSSGNFKASLADLDQLDATSRRPGLESDRVKLIPVLTFYRGANLAAMGERDAAKEAFISYLGFVPAATIASPPFPKAVVAAFELAQKELRGKSNKLIATFADFVRPGGAIMRSDDLWANSAVRYLLTAEEKKAYAALTSQGDREAFVSDFWKQLDPTPGSEANEFRDEFERRVAFSDANFSTDSMRGRDSERGAVFIFLGPPTYVGVAELATRNDPMAALRTEGNSDMSKAFHGGGATPVSSLTGQHTNDTAEHDLARGSREAWYYRRARIPAGIAFNEVEFDFLTKEGYGTGVLQKDPQPLTTLGKAVELSRQNKKLN
jgi:GWxTD domain-containing protein